MAAEKPPSSEDRWYDDPNQSIAPPRSRWRWVVIGLAVAAIGGLGWVSFQMVEQRLTAGGEVPTIMADKSPIKVKPAGSDALDLATKKDTLVHGIGSRDKGGQKVERLLPGPEEPMAKPPATPMVPPPLAARPQPSAPTAALTAAPTAASAPAPPAQAAAPPAAPSVPPKAPAVAAIAPAAGGEAAFQLQLGAFRSNQAADAAWARIKTANIDVLSAATPTMSQIDLGQGRGIYVRIQAGSYGDRDSAVAACLRLRERKVECFVVRG
ncbi:MAG: SPOR domain-containing protein [Alphaproteobacteria bacterium]|nr:SPOR domain-containing protein [Alphaproteobacteria bacterium]